MQTKASKIVAPLAPALSPGVDPSDPAARLPDDLLSDQVKRLMLFSAVAMGAWTFGIAIDRAFAFVVPGGAPFPLWKSHLVEAVAIIVSAAMFLYARYSRDSAERKIDVGLAYLIVNAFLVALLNTWVMTPATVSSIQPSWNTVLVLVYSMIAPATRPRKMLAATLVAASMDPLGMWLAHLRGVATPSVVQTFNIFMPNYATGCVAYWLLTGPLVFTADTPMALLVHHARTPATPPSAQTELTIPAELDHLVLSCLAKDPAERPQSAMELSRRLGAIEGASAWTEERARDWWARHQPARA